MRLEPGIDTRDMESVVALRQQPESLVFLKLAQANRALRPFDQPLALLVLARRDGAYDRRRESDGADVPDRVVQDRPLVVVEELVVDNARLRLRPRRSPAPGPRPARIPPRVQRVAHDEDEERGEGGEEGDQERRQMVGPSSVRVQRGGFILRRTRRRQRKRRYWLAADVRTDVQAGRDAVPPIVQYRMAGELAEVWGGHVDFDKEQAPEMVQRAHHRGGGRDGYGGFMQEFEERERA